MPDHTLVFYWVATLVILNIWFFKRSWLERNPGKSIVEKALILLAAVGSVVWFISHRRLEFLFLLFPVTQFYAYNFMFTIFDRMFHRSPTPPSIGGTWDAEFQDYVFNVLFLVIAALLPLIYGGLLLQKMAR